MKMKRRSKKKKSLHPPVHFHRIFLLCCSPTRCCYQPISQYVMNISRRDQIARHQRKWEKNWIFIPMQLFIRLLINPHGVDQSASVSRSTFNEERHQSELITSAGSAIFSRGPSMEVEWARHERILHCKDHLTNPQREPCVYGRHQSCNCLD